MSELYPYGYAGAMVTRSELEAKTTVAKLHPEFWRRYIALMEDAADRGVSLGVGTGWRVQPNPPPAGFAQPGNSNHEGFPADGVSGGAVAIDTVPSPSWDEMEGMLASYGLRSFRDVNNEPWHIQPIEIPASRNWRTEPWKLEKFDLPGEEDMPLSDDDIQKIAKAVWQFRIMGDLPNENQTAQVRLRSVHGIVRKFLGGYKESESPTDPTMLKQIHDNTKKV